MKFPPEKMNNARRRRIRNELAAWRKILENFLSEKQIKLENKDKWAAFVQSYAIGSMTCLFLCYSTKVVLSESLQGSASKWKWIRQRTNTLLIRRSIKPDLEAAQDVDVRWDNEGNERRLKHLSQSLPFSHSWVGVSRGWCKIQNVCKLNEVLCRGKTRLILIEDSLEPSWTTRQDFLFRLISVALGRSTKWK